MVENNSSVLVSEGCGTLFVCSYDVSLVSKARLFSFFYLLWCDKYIILSFLLSKKAGALVLFHPQEYGNWILHLKVNFHNGITQISVSLFYPFCFNSSISQSPPPWCISSFAVVYSIHLQTSFVMLNAEAHGFFFPFCVVTLPLATLSICVL